MARVLRREHDTLPTCARCGYVHAVRDTQRPSCGAHTNRWVADDGVTVLEEDDGGTRTLVPCGNPPIRGAVVCGTHGGSAGQVRAAAAGREAQAAVDRVLRLAVVDVDPRHSGRTPDEQLLEEVGRSSQIVEWLASQVATLSVPDPNDAGPLEDIMGVDENGEEVRRPNRFVLWGPDHTGDAAPHIYWTMLNQERDRHARLCKLAIDAGISERLVRIAEAQGQQVVAVIVHVIDSLGLPEQAREQARRLAAAKLRSLGPAPRIIEH